MVPRARNSLAQPWTTLPWCPVLHSALAMHVQDGCQAGDSSSHPGQGCGHRTERWSCLPSGGGLCLAAGGGSPHAARLAPLQGCMAACPLSLSLQLAAPSSARPDPPCRPLPPDPAPKVMPGPGWGSWATPLWPLLHVWLHTSSRGPVGLWPLRGISAGAQHPAELALPRGKPWHVLNSLPACWEALPRGHCPPCCLAVLQLSHCPCSLCPGFPPGQAAPPHTPPARGPRGARHSGNGITAAALACGAG